MKLSTILIDIDSTIYDAKPCYANAMVAAHQAAAGLCEAWQSIDVFRADYSASRDALVARIGHQPAWHSRFLYFLGMIEGRLGGSQLDTAERLCNAYWDGYAEVMVVDDSCAETIAWFRQQDLRVVWTTNFTCEPQVWKLRQLGLVDAADFFVASEEAGREKPAPEIFLLALDKTGAAPSAAWMIGDDLRRDIAGARATGIGTVWMRRGEAEADGSGPDHTVRSWLEIRRLVQRELDRRIS